MRNEPRPGPSGALVLPILLGCGACIIFELIHRVGGRSVTRKGRTLARSSVQEIPPEEIVRRGQALYDQTIRPKVEAGHIGWFLVVNVLTGEYEMDPDDLEAAKLASARFGAAPLFAVRIGYPAAYHLGGQSEASRA